MQLIKYHYKKDDQTISNNDNVKNTTNLEKIIVMTIVKCIEEWRHTRFTALLQDNPSDVAAEQSVVLYFDVAAIKTILTLLPHAAPILKSAGWHASKQYYRNGTLKVSRQTVTPEIFTPTAFPVTTLQIKPGIKIYWLYTLVAWHQQIQQYYSKSKQTVHWKISKDLVKKTCRSQTTVACKTITVYRTNALQVKPTFLSA